VAPPKKKEYVEGKPKTTLDSAGICLFCNHDSGKVEENLEHMKDVHTFSLPYSDLLKDRLAVLRYLAEKIQVGNICIGCNNLRTGGFKNAQAVQQHMQDKGHTFLELNIFQEEYANFVKHKDKFLLKRQPMTGRISAVMTMKEIEEMKNADKEGKDVNVSGTSGEFSKVSAVDSAEVLSLRSSSSVSSGPVPPKEVKKVAGGEEWEDMELHDVEEGSEPEKVADLVKDSSLSMSEVSSISETTVADEHIMLNTGELLLSNGKLYGLA